MEALRSELIDDVNSIAVTLRELKNKVAKNIMSNELLEHADTLDINGTDNLDR